MSRSLRFLVENKLIVWVLLWALRSGQFDDLEGPAHRILLDEERIVDPTAASREDGKKIAGEEVPAKNTLKIQE